MNVNDIMVMQVATCRPNDTLAGAIGRMLEHDCGCLPVVDVDERVVAVITDRDIAVAGLLRGLPLAEVRVDESMSDGVVTCKRTESLADLGQRMRARQLRRLPVVDDDGRLVGIVTLNDLAVALSPDGRLRGKSEVARAALAALLGVSHHRALVPSTAVLSPRVDGAATDSAG